MAWITPRTWVAGETVTAALMNTHLRDNLNALRENHHPVGIIIELGVATNPNTLFGYGTWTAWGTGRVTVAIDAGQTEFDTLDETGGAKTHTLTTAELPSHAHAVGLSGTGGSSGTIAATEGGAQDDSVSTGNNGSGSAHNNLQPYIVVYRWKRTA